MLRHRRSGRQLLLNHSVQELNKLHQNCGCAQVTLKKCVDNSIVDFITGEMLSSSDEEPRKLDQAPSAFEDTMDSSENDHGDTSRYSISIKNRVQFELVVD